MNRLPDQETLLIARQLGYTGVALKACKGISESLLMAAAARHYGMFLCVQDLTCIAASFLQSVSLAAHIPTINAVEGNGRQYCPAWNAMWDELYRPLYRVMGGVVPSELLTKNGLGYSWPKELLPKGLRVWLIDSNASIAVEPSFCHLRRAITTLSFPTVQQASVMMKRSHHSSPPVGSI